MSQHMPGLHEPGDEVDVTVFSRPGCVTYTAKWWYRPICWLLRRPTTIRLP